MGLAEFFAIEPERPRKAFYRADELTEIGKKPISYLQIGDSLFGRALQILKERYEPGSDTGRVPLVHQRWFEASAALIRSAPMRPAISSRTGSSAARQAIGEARTAATSGPAVRPSAARNSTR